MPRSLFLAIIIPILTASLDFASTAAVAGDLRFLDEARAVYARTLTTLEGCGLTRLDHEDPRLPRPQVPADDAIVNAAGAILAYTNFESGGGVSQIEFKAPNGGYSHAITFSPENIQYTTPYQGLIAETSRFRTVDGWHYRFRCGSNYVSFELYQQCIATHWHDVLTSQLCR